LKLEQSRQEHKPLGSLESGWSKWEDHPFVYRIEGLTAQLAAQMSCRHDPDVERIYFYKWELLQWELRALARQKVF
jgi:hypothetical protein